MSIRRVFLLASLAWAASCVTSGAPPSAPADPAKTALAAGDWSTALTLCAPPAAGCDAEWCTLLAETMTFVDQDFDGYLLPIYRAGDAFSPSSADLARLIQIDERLARISSDADGVVSGACTYELDHLPVYVGDPSAPLVDADARGAWTTTSALMLAAIADSIRYVFASVAGTAGVSPAADGGLPPMPALLSVLQTHLVEHDTQLWRQPADPSALRGGWYDRNGNGIPDAPDALLVDLFVPGSTDRVFDFSTASFVRGQSLPLGRLPTSSPTPRCGYAKWHIDTLIESDDVGTTDGMSFSPDGTQLAFPMRVDGNYQVQIAAADGTNPRCLTCATPAWSDGVRWRPGAGSTTLLFISNRDHPDAIGGAGGGAGQELYAMRSDGSSPTRLTVSGDWATNYHANWSNDGQRVVWGSTQARTWDVMVADFVDDAQGMRLVDARRLTHDTTWWETHGFTHDDRAVIATNTRSGLLSPDIYAIDLQTGAPTRLTDDPAWDEHAHLSPDGTRMAWISARWQPASVERITGGQLSPVFDFFWIDPGIIWAFTNPPAGYSTELTLMSADGTSIERLTTDGEVVADNEWSPDGTKIVFRQSLAPPGSAHPPRLRVLTFDDCP